MFTASSLLVCCALSAAGESEVAEYRNLTYAQPDGNRLLLNLFVPRNVERPPLVVYIHGGSWRAGSYQNCSVAWLAEEGFAVASIEYRFTDVAPFPAQIHDCKAALRWLRAHAEKYGYDATKIGVCGSSAGGHLAALLGTSGDVADLEGTVGGNLGESSRVAAVIDYFGPTDFVLRSKTHPARANAPDSGTYALLGGPAIEKVEQAKRASSVTYVSPDDPPLLIFHGDRDRTVYMDQSESLRDAYQKAGLPVELVVVAGAAHGGQAFVSGEPRRQATEFFRRHLADYAESIRRKRVGILAARSARLTSTARCATCAVGPAKTARMWGPRGPRHAPNTGCFRGAPGPVPFDVSCGPSSRTSATKPARSAR